MNRTIATIGYEGTTIEKFVGTLKHASIDVLIDVRDVPLSRKKGFSKNGLAQILVGADIEYVHLKGLGDPKDGRDAARAGEYDLFQKIFGRHMQTETAIRDLGVAADIVRTRRACLMCFECCHEKCHRSIVAERLSEITHLTVTPLTAQGGTIGRTVLPIRTAVALHAGI
jgi:uncharacterized protein (DUF488 family)